MCCSIAGAIATSCAGNAASLARFWLSDGGRGLGGCRTRSAGRLLPAARSVRVHGRMYMLTAACLCLTLTLVSQVVNVVQQTTQLDGNGFLGSDGWMPGDYGALESVWTLDGASVCVFVRELGAVVCAR